MDAKTLEALKASIAKWERNAEAKTPAKFKISDKDCRLCKLFLYYGRCDGCPVSEKTGQQYCRGTPYIHACAARASWALGDQSAIDRAHAAARDEVAFLKSLLPEATP